MLRRSFLGLTGLSLACLLASCAVTPPAVDPAARQALAPTGVLRIGVYAGSPSSMVRDAKTGERVGVALKLGEALAKQLGVPAKVVEHERLALVIDAVTKGEADFTFTNASEARARVVDFTPALIQLELGYLLPSNSPIKSVADVDAPGRRVGVSEGSSSQAALGRQFKMAKLVPAASIQQAQDLMRRGEVDAFATNKAILNEMVSDLPAFKVLEGRWGLENLAIAVPKGRDAGKAYLQQFAKDVQASGLLQSIVSQAGLRGTVKPE